MTELIAAEFTRDSERYRVDGPLSREGDFAVARISKSGPRFWEVLHPDDIHPVLFSDARSALLNDNLELINRLRKRANPPSRER